MQISELSDKELRTEIDNAISEMDRIQARLSELEREESKRIAKKQITFPMERINALFDYMKKWRDEEISKGEKIKAQVIETAHNTMKNLLDLPE